MVSRKRYKNWMRGVALWAATAVLAGTVDMTAMASVSAGDLQANLTSVSENDLMASVSDNNVNVPEVVDENDVIEESDTINEIVVLNESVASTVEQSEWYFDFGTASSTLQSDWIRVTGDAAYNYSAEVGYGWVTNPAQASEWVEKNPESVVLPIGMTELKDMAYDRIRGSVAYEFAAAVPNGEYEVMVYGGWPGTTEYKLDYVIEGKKQSWLKIYDFGCVTDTVTVSDGTLNVGVGQNSGTKDIKGLVIRSTDLADLTVPENLTATAGTVTDEGVKVILGFDTVSGAVSYNLYQSIDGETTLLQKVTTNSQVVTVAPDTRYVFNVTAVDKYGMESAVSDSVVLDLTGEEVQTEWYFDFGQSGSAVQDGWTKITKTDLYDKVLGYGWNTAPNNIDYVQSSPDTTLPEELQAVAIDMIRGDNTWDFAVDVPNAQYEVTVYAGYTANTKDVNYIIEDQKILKTRFTAFDSVVGEVVVEDGQLNLKNAGTSMVEIRGLMIKQTLAPPTALSYEIGIKTDSDAKVEFTFKGIEEAVTYNLYQKSSIGDGLMKKIADFTDTEYTIDVSLGATYEYYVTAVTAEGTETVASNIVKVDLIDTAVTKPSVPQNVKVEESKSNAMKLVWDEAAEGEKVFLYNVYRSQTESDSVTDYKLIGTSETASYTDTDPDVTGNVHWYYKVQAQNAGGVSELSETVVTAICDELIASVGEWYDRAPVAINLAGDDGAEVSLSATDADGKEYTSGVYLSWRSYEEDFAEDGKTLQTTFDVYRNGSLIGDNLQITNLLDQGGKYGDTYKVVGSNDEELNLTATEIPVWENQYLELQLVKPDAQTMPIAPGETVAEVSDYVPNDTMLADLDGDGDLDLVVKWRPRNFKDNGSSGYTASTFYDGYDVNFATGEVKLLWRIDMGVNIRSGSHYEVVQVWDYNNDGIAEVALKTADGTTVYHPVYENGNVASFTEVGHIGCCSAADLPVSNTDAAHDYRETGTYYGHVITGPEYFTMFSGKDGSIIDTIDYEPELGDISSWGDAYGNRGFRFLAATAYLDGVTPHYIQCRGYYERTALAAYKLVPDKDGDGKEDIEKVWLFDTENYDGQYEGQGNHGLAIADVDNDGKDEIVYGGLLLDHDGTPVYSTELDHGDAMHVTDLVLWNPGQEVMSVHEHDTVYYAAEVRDAATGTILMGMHIPGGIDLGRGVADDIDPTSTGGEWWTVISPDYDATDGEPSVASKQGSVLSTQSKGEDLIILANHASPASNALIYWDGDLMREIQDKEWNFSAKPDGAPVSVQIGKWNYIDNVEEYIFDSTEIWAHGTKGNMGIVADFLGDWREELITMCSFGDFASKANGVDKIRVYATTIQTDYVIPCLMEDLQYYEALAWQNTGYNQPAHLSYMLSEGTITAQLTAKELLYNAVTIEYTEACDGTRWGHPVTGYEIYRAEVDRDGNVGSYTKIADVGSDVLTYTDTTVEEAKEYCYTVAAVVDAKTSYHSEPLQVVVPRKIKEILPVTLTALVKGNDPEAALPETVTILSVDGVQEEAMVTWDISGFDNNKVGEQTIIANVNGWDTPIKVTWKVIDKVVVSFHEIDTIKTVVGQTPELPGKVTAVYNDGDTKEVDVTWNTADYDVNIVGTYEVSGAVTGETLAPTVTIRVAEDYVVEAKQSYVEVEIGNALNSKMPTEVEVKYVSGKIDTLAVVWELTNVSTDAAANIDVVGIVDADFEVVAHVSVVYPAVKRFDFGADSNMEVEGWIGVIGITKNATTAMKTAKDLDIHYTANRGYGWADENAYIDGRSGQAYTQDGVLPIEVYQDMALCGGQTFLVDLPNGNYVVDFISGSTDANTLRGTVEGVSFSVSSAAKAYAVDSAEVEVKDGQLTVDISTGTVRMNGIVIRAVNILTEDKPIPAPDDSNSSDSSAEDNSSSDSSSSEETVIDWNEVKTAVMTSTAATTTQSTGVNLNYTSIGETKVPTTILNEIKGENVTIAFQSGNGVALSISGQKLDGVDVNKLKNVDLTVNHNPNTIPDAVVASKAAVAKRELSIKDTGNFGVAVDMHVNVGKENAGKVANLYRYNPTSGRLEFCSHFVITAEGQSMFAVGRGGDYLITVTNTIVNETTWYFGGDYTVQAGDNLSKIAIRYHMPLAELVRRNPQLRNLNLIRPGQKLHLN